MVSGKPPAPSKSTAPQGSRREDAQASSRTGVWGRVARRVALPGARDGRDLPTQPLPGSRHSHGVNLTAADTTQIPPRGPSRPRSRGALVWGSLLHTEAVRRPGYADRTSKESAGLSKRFSSPRPRDGPRTRFAVKGGITSLPRPLLPATSILRNTAAPSGQNLCPIYTGERAVRHPGPPAAAAGFLRVSSHTQKSPPASPPENSAHGPSPAAPERPVQGGPRSLSVSRAVTRGVRRAAAAPAAACCLLLWRASALRNAITP